MSWKFHTRKFLLSKEILILMMVFIQSGFAIQCFVCDSGVNPGCTNLKSNSSIVPETCTLEKMKSINTWLFELNEIAYFKNDLKTIPPMHCQKVVAKQTKDSQPVTARFCQLDTRDTDACTILKDKLTRSAYPNSENEGQLLMECSVCKTDRCNGTQRIRLFTALGYIFIASILKIFG